MKNFTLLFLVLLLAFTGQSYAQQNDTVTDKQNKLLTERNLQKGRSVIFLNDLGFGTGSGNFFTNIGLSYGYFVADKHLLRLDINAFYYSKEYHSYRAGLFYRYYFSNKWKIKPFVEVGGGIGTFTWGLDSGNELFGFGMVNAGAVVHVKKVGFELGIKMIYNDHRSATFSILPSFGISYTF